MSHEQDPSSRHAVSMVIKALPLASSFFAVGVGLLVLVGWQFDVESLKRVLPGFVAMNPATAILFIVCGVSLFLSVQFRESRIAVVIARVLASFAFVVALAEFLEAAGMWHSPADEIVFAHKLRNPADAWPNRMAPNTTFNFFLLGLSLLLPPSKTGRVSLSQALAIVVAFGAILPITGYLYGVHSFKGLASFIPMAVHTATTFLMLAAGIFFAVPQSPLVEIFVTRDPRGVMARRLFPLAVLVTLSLGWVRAWGERNQFYESEFGTALFAITLSILFVLLVRWTVWTIGKLEVERNTAHARLHDLNRRKDEMIAVVSHDLCSPLTGVRMVIDMLRTDRGESKEELLNLMDHSARRMVSMVRGLLDVAKIEASEDDQLEREELLVSEVIDNSMEPLRINANAKQISLGLEVSPSEPTLFADRLRVSQIFNNLLSNAVKFTPKGGRILVEVVPVRDGVQITVQDSGLGIPEADLPHIFDKYYQASTKATNGEKGTGLGLAIVRELVLKHDGRIDVKSEINRGTRFTVFLPAKVSSGMRSFDGKKVLPDSIQVQRFAERQ
jgi:signal transduction histidine kinase